MHRLENNAESCGKAKKIYDEVQEKVTTITQSVEGSSESQPIDMNNLFVETAGIQKGRVFGIGNMSKTYTNSSCRSFATSSINEHEMTRRLHEMVEVVRAEMRQEMEHKIEEMMRNMMQGRVNIPGVNSAAPRYMFS